MTTEDRYCKLDNESKYMLLQDQIDRWDSRLAEMEQELRRVNDDETRLRYRKEVRELEMQRLSLLGIIRYAERLAEKDTESDGDDRLGDLLANIERVKRERSGAD